MILRKEIAEKSVLWGVPPDTVDKDWVLGHLLSAFYEVPPLLKKSYSKEELVFANAGFLITAFLKIWILLQKILIIN